MPKSRIRKKKDGSAAKPEKQQIGERKLAGDAKGDKGDKSDQKVDRKKPQKIDMRTGGGVRRWVAPLMLALFVIGLLWIVVYYVAEGDLPIGAIGAWNIVVGFGFIGAGFVVSTQWK
ncbi:cell division protein CrgA [Streptomyces bohaiensis]|uniref:Cell division protein CrgA n=1 Tax=Streptomyces bohaiensis TaxID=1431344 RepID=A0ABX1C3R9_9ACTN|nr:cell division protein CrgA [Streptomyces bohaiensis]NJQ13874.1 cell division protein CrgA [Streptomyces bohaiensis]